MFIVLIIEWNNGENNRAKIIQTGVVMISKIYNFLLFVTASDKSDAQQSSLPNATLRGTHFISLCVISVINTRGLYVRRWKIVTVIWVRCREREIG